MKLTLKQQRMLSALHSQYHACWCSCDFGDQGFSRHAIDPQSSISKICNQISLVWGFICSCDKPCYQTFSQICGVCGVWVDGDSISFWWEYIDDHYIKMGLRSFTVHAKALPIVSNLRRAICWLLTLHRTIFSYNSIRNSWCFIKRLYDFAKLQIGFEVDWIIVKIHKRLIVEIFPI